MSNNNTQELINFIEEKINHYAKRILEKPDRADRAYMGQLNFYVSFRNIVKFYHKYKVDMSLNVKKMREMPSYRDFGLIEAINDTLAFLGLFNSTAKFFQTDIDFDVQEKNIHTQELVVFIEEKINHYANSIPENQDRADRAALGQLTFYISFRNIIKLHHKHTVDKTFLDVESMRDMPSYRDFGLIDAVNDTLVFMNLFKPTGERKKFFQVDVLEP